MPLTTIDPMTALIVIDLQKGIVGHPVIDPLPQVVNRTRELIDAFRAENLPIVLVNVVGRAPGRTEQGPRSSQPVTEGWSELLPELGQQPGDILVTKRSWEHSQQPTWKLNSSPEASPRSSSPEWQRPAASRPQPGRHTNRASM